MWDDVLRWFDAHGSGVSAIAALAAAIIAVMTLIRTRSDSRRRSQPSVVAEIRPAKGSHTVIDFVVRNTGPTTARDVTVSFDPPITIPEERKGEPLVTSFLIRRYSVPIPTVAPGQELTNSFWVGVRRGNQIANDEPTPDQFTVSVKYRGIGRRWLRDSFAISVDTVTLSTWSESHPSKSVESRVGEIAASLKTIAEALPKP